MTMQRDKNILEVMEELAATDATFWAYSMSKVDKALVDEATSSPRTPPSRDHVEAVAAAIEGHGPPPAEEDNGPATAVPTVKRLCLAESGVRIWRCERHVKRLYATAFESASETCDLCVAEDTYLRAAANYFVAYGTAYLASKRHVVRADHLYKPNPGNGLPRHFHVYEETQSFAKRERIEKHDRVRVHVDGAGSVIGWVTAVASNGALYTVVYNFDPQEVAPDAFAVALHQADMERRFPARSNTDLGRQRTVCEPCHRCSSRRLDILPPRIRCADCGMIVKLKIAPPPATAWERVLSDGEGVRGSRPGA